jgi:hypothetical protein
MHSFERETSTIPAYVAASPSGAVTLGAHSIAATTVLLEVLRTLGSMNVTLTLKESIATDGVRAVRLIIESDLLGASDWKPLKP